ncbi:MAG: FkbM family methyltransferase [Planctomycetaceae bacterium]
MPRFPRKLFDRILSHPTLMEQPPVLVDIGASGAVHPAWKPLAPASICIAFDADQRELTTTTSTQAGYRQLHLFPAAVVEQPEEKARFYLTKSPYCSSRLKPNQEALQVWNFAPLFEVSEEVEVPAITLPEVLEQLQLTYIDWFKTDSQGTDLRLFLSLPDEIRHQILIAEFEPGLIDAYHNEDKLHQILARLEQEPFWLSRLDLKGPHRFSPELLQNQSSFKQRLWLKGQRITPGWGEMCYLHEFEGEQTLRRYLLGWMIATIQEQHGFAFELCSKAISLFNEPLLIDLKSWSERRLTNLGLRKIPGWILDKLLKR